MAQRKRWTAGEMQILESEYGATDIQELAKRLNRSVDAIHYRASKSKISFYRPGIKADQYTQLDRIEAKIDKLLSLLSHRGSVSIRWRDEDEEFIQRSLNTMTYQEMADKLGRSFSAVVRKAQDMGLQKKKRMVMGNEEVSFVESNYHSMTLSDISQNLGVSYTKVVNTVSKLVAMGRLERKYKKRVKAERKHNE